MSPWSHMVSPLFVSSHTFPTIKTSRRRRRSAGRFHRMCNPSSSTKSFFVLPRTRFIWRSEANSNPQLRSILLLDKEYTYPQRRRKTWTCEYSSCLPLAPRKSLHALDGGKGYDRMNEFHFAYVKDLSNRVHLKLLRPIDKCGMQWTSIMPLTRQLEKEMDYGFNRLLGLLYSPSHTSVKLGPLKMSCL